MDESSPSGLDTTPGDSGRTPTDQNNGEPVRKRAKVTHAKSMSQGGIEAFQDDPLDYPRRRAVIACAVCRSRKSKCDGGRPKCKLCTDLGAVCTYREPGAKLDAGDKLILERLSNIESLLQSSLLGRPAEPMLPESSSIVPEGRPFSASIGSCAGSLPLSGFGISPANNISAMPKSHTTPALHLLQWPVVRDLVSRPCDPQVLMQLELSREPLVVETPYTLDLAPETTLGLARAYFENANVWYAAVDPNLWHSQLRTASKLSFRSGPESCIVLLVLALGQAASLGDSILQVPQGQPIPGMDYFGAAWTLLPSLMIRNDVVSAQCHILAAAYLLYIVRPLEAWSLLCNASIKMQLLLSAPNSIHPQVRELSERVYWNTLLIESDLLAELDLPHSGIVSFEESMRLPRSFPYDAITAGSEEPPGTDDIWYFLAEIALRRLLNRVSNLLYSQNRSSIASLEPIVAELEYQLEQWYANLPQQIQFPRERIAARDKVQTVLRLRYFACRTIIFRPYIQAVLGDESLIHEPGVRAACEKGLDACYSQLENILAHHNGHLPYLFQGALSVTSQSLLLMGATLSSVLSALLPASHQVEAVIMSVVSEVQRLGRLAPSIELCAELLREAEERRQLLLQRPR
ncbi:related to C6 finger domain protein [Ramularia collo-cygni]|uniref:Related to C6 finger domain protein n=1 Tax=Ramularia collo-cygni TaxID=112498 RepID=A0A2D3VSS2_9PEZI|nr:related to C6 finger domain protein [Ramularia collo-cygni]CZT25773.1 related to C6 finger domain protein [Ramularia collo-cygni]